MDRIISSFDIAHYYGFLSTSEWLISHSQKLQGSGMCRTVFSGEVNHEVKAIAYIDCGRWLANCPSCGKPMYVDPSERVLYCFGCGDGSGVSVEFPANLSEIESALLRRPVRSDANEKNILVRVIQERPSIPGLARNWRPGVDVETLLQENLEAGL